MIDYLQLAAKDMLSRRWGSILRTFDKDQWEILVDDQVQFLMALRQEELEDVLDKYTQ